MIPGINTGGGGLSYSDTSSATAGPTTSGVNQTIGGLTVGGNTGWLWAVVALVAAVVGWMLWQNFK
mgnify:CR=1 FL=1